MNDATAVARELDDAHARAQEAFARRDHGAYMDFFDPEVVYKHSDGRTFDRDGIGRHIRVQMIHFRSTRSEFDRESLAVDGQDAVEVVTQHGTFETRFLVLHRVWSLSRRGRYSWRRSPEGWRILRVDVLEERTRPARTWLAFG